MPAVAFSNNDMALVAWTYDRHLDGCLGFAVVQIDGDGKERVLPALARFEGQDPDKDFTTSDAPVQKFWWKDLFANVAGPADTRSSQWGEARPMAEAARGCRSACEQCRDADGGTSHLFQGLFQSRDRCDPGLEQDAPRPTQRRSAHATYRRPRRRDPGAAFGPAFRRGNPSPRPRRQGGR
jgi:hypothetical protein